jgi:hypothetical protein
MVSFPDEFPFVKRSRAEAIAPVAPLPPEQHLAPQVQSAPDVVINDVPALKTSVSAPIESRPPTDRRKIKRDRLATHGMLRVDGHHGPPLKVEMEDISVAGLRFRSSQPLDVGDKAQIRLEVGPFRWTTRLRVVHCTKDELGRATLGCAFLRTELLRPWPLAAA